MAMTIATWQSKKLRNLPIQIIDGDRSARYPKRHEFQSEGLLFLNTTNINDNRLDLHEANFIGSEKFAQIKKGRLQRLDIVMTTRGSVGKVALFDCNHSTGLINAQMLILRADGETLDHKFLFYITCSDNFQSTVRNFASGSAQPQIPIQDLREIEIRFPSLPAQQKIAAILSTYDDLIENNMQRIKILEEMAQAIYREWFVHFRFPGHEKVKMISSPLGKMPEGWEVKTLGDMCIIVMGQSPKSEFYNEKAEGLPFHQGVTNFGDRFPRDQIYCTIQNRMAESGDILFSVRAPVGRINIADKKIAIGRGLSAIRSKAGTQAFIFQQLKEQFKQEDSMGGGTIFKSVTKEDMHGIRMLSPSEEIVKRFEKVVQPISRDLEILTTKNSNLRRTRNLLLPKLLSGRFISKGSG